MQDDAVEVLADLERLALAGLRHETERLAAALRKEHRREREEGPKGDSVISPQAAVRMSCLDALELFVRAHNARLQVEEEGAGVPSGEASIVAGKAEDGSD